MKPVDKHYLEWIERAIQKTRYGKDPASLYEPIRYLMGLGGKRLRPLLTLYAFALYKNNVKSIVPYAVAVEAFHNFTLMHDDIMDNAPIRRGKPTIHEKWNVNTAILSGDVMLVKVYDMFLSLDPPVLKEVLEVFNRCAAEVCEGQQLDMEFETMEKVSERQYIDMIRKKTAVLLGFSVELGAILAGASVEDRKALRDFGIQIGIGFQLMDDYLDAYADPKKFGKQVGGDIIANKKTYLLIKALETARGKDRNELKTWLDGTKHNSKKKVAAVIALYNRLGMETLVKKRIDYYFKKGFSSLEKVTARVDKKDLLNRYTRALIDRER